ncbi:MAG: nuclease [Thermosphaera sp.]
MSRSERLRLSDRRDIERRTLEIASILRERGYTPVVMGEFIVDPLELKTTQTHIESDKLGLVLKKTLFEKYSAPIVVVVGKNATKYIIDGHHRALVSLWLRQPVKAFLINTPAYIPGFSTSLHKVKFINPADTPRELMVWRHMVNTIHFLEEVHDLIAHLWFEDIKLTELKPTQRLVDAMAGVQAIVDEPILVYNYRGSYYVVDGHKRVCKNLLLDRERILAIVFTLDGAKIGIVERAEIIGDIFTKEACRKIFQSSISS